MASSLTELQTMLDRAALITQPWRLIPFAAALIPTDRVADGAVYTVTARPGIHRPTFDVAVLAHPSTLKRIERMFLIAANRPVDGDAELAALLCWAAETWHQRRSTRARAGGRRATERHGPQTPEV